jgi:hypothetical protein
MRLKAKRHADEGRMRLKVTRQAYKEGRMRLKARLQTM